MIPPHIIAFKSDKLRADFEKISPRLQALILAAGSIMYHRYGVTLVVTSLMRADKKSVHGYGNGVDFRTKIVKGRPGGLTEEQGDYLVRLLKWDIPYYSKLPMPKKPKYSVKDERKKKNAPHIHGQVNWRESGE